MNPKNVISGRIIWWIVGGMIGVIVILWGFNRWAEYEIIRRLESDQSQISSGLVKVRAGAGKVVLHQVEWSRDSSFVRAEQVNVSGFSLLRFLIYRKIIIDLIEIEAPEVHLGSFDKQEKFSEIFKDPQSLEIEKVRIRRGDVLVEQKDRALHPTRISLPLLEMDSLWCDSMIAREKIPFRYGSVMVNIDSFYYQIDSLYEISAAFVDLKNEEMFIDSFRIHPRYDRQEFQQHIPFQKTRADLVVPQIRVEGVRWEMKEDGFFVGASALTLDSADLRLYRDKRLAENPIIKPMYSKMIRDLPLGLDVDSVMVKGGEIEYDILFSDQREVGTIHFAGLNGKIIHVTNQGMNQEDFPETLVRAEARFMEEAKITLNWSFFIDEPTDEFHVSGSLSRIGEEGMNSFLRPAFHVSVQGAIEELQFDFTGNDQMAVGDMRMMYDELKIEWLKEDGRQKNKVLSAVANLFLKNKMSGPAEKEDIDVERVRTKSFWAYLWKMVQTGSLEFLL